MLIEDTFYGDIFSSSESIRTSCYHRYLDTKYTRTRHLIEKVTGACFWCIWPTICTTICITTSTLCEQRTSPSYRRSISSSYSCSRHTSPEGDLEISSEIIIHHIRHARHRSTSTCAADERREIGSTLSRTLS